jgi:uncharacterized membrane protein
MLYCVKKESCLKPKCSKKVTYMKLRILIVLLVIHVTLATGCQYNKSDVLPDCATVPARFSDNVLPLIHTKCATACHNAFSTNGGGPLTNYTQIKNKAAQIKIMVETRKMPKNGSLTDAEIKIISCWVDAGAVNN